MVKGSVEYQKLLSGADFKEKRKRSYLGHEIAEDLIDIRVKLNLSQEEFSKKVGLKQPSVARLESGENLPRLSTLLKIANALGTKLYAPKFEMLCETTVSQSAHNSVSEIHEQYIVQDQEYAIFNPRVGSSSSQTFSEGRVGLFANLALAIGGR